MQTTAERMALIRLAAAKFKAKQARQAHIKRVEQMVNENADERYWTDAPKYAEQYYGETFRATTRFDNDWGDY